MFFFTFFTMICNNHSLVFALDGCVAWLKATAGRVSPESSNSDGGFNALLLVGGISTNFSISGISNGLCSKMPVHFKQLNFFLHNGHLSTFDKHEKHDTQFELCKSSFGIIVFISFHLHFGFISFREMTGTPVTRKQKVIIKISTIVSIVWFYQDVSLRLEHLKTFNSHCSYQRLIVPMIHT